MERSSQASRNSPHTSCLLTLASPETQSSWSICCCGDLETPQGSRGNAWGGDHIVLYLPGSTQLTGLVQWVHAVGRAKGAQNLPPTAIWGRIARENICIWQCHLSCFTEHYYLGAIIILVLLPKYRGMENFINLLKVIQLGSGRAGPTCPLCPGARSLNQATEGGCLPMALLIWWCHVWAWDG